MSLPLRLPQRVPPRLPLRSARIDTSAVAHNLRVVRSAVDGRDVLADVSADAHGHGSVAIARAALDAGARGLVVATIGEGVALRHAGVGSDALILAWQHPVAGPGPLAAALALAADSRITPVVSSAEQLAEAVRAGILAVHLAVAVGDSVIGCQSADWGDLVNRAARIQQESGTRVSGIMGLPERRTPRTRADLETLTGDSVEFEHAVAVARAAGLTPTLTHAGGSAAALVGAIGGTDAARIGRALYGLSPFQTEAAAGLGLRPAMTVSARVIATKTIAAGEGISYGYTYRTSARSNLALVAIGYVHGIDRAASNRGTVRLNGATYPIAGRIAMDVFVLDLGNGAAEVGDEVVLFGDPDRGHPSVADWAGKIGKDADAIVTGITAQVVREYS